MKLGFDINDPATWRGFVRIGGCLVVLIMLLAGKDVDKAIYVLTAFGFLDGGIGVGTRSNGDQ